MNSKVSLVAIQSVLSFYKLASSFYYFDNFNIVKSFH